MIRINTKAQLVCLAVAFLAEASAQTATWTAPVVLSTGGQGWEAAAAIDANGNSMALWDERTTQDQLWSRSKPSAGNWSHAMQVSPALQTTYVFPVVRVTPAGFATAVWSDENGVWTADRPSLAKWNPPQLLIPGASSPIFVMNSLGDAAVAWTVGGATSPNSTVMAVVRPAGGSWSSQQTIARGVHIIADHVGIGENGAAIVTWESYTAVCSEGICLLSNFRLHAAREDAGAGTWVDSGVLLGPDDNSHDARVALDATGRAILEALGGTGAYMSATQGGSGGAWSSFDTIVDLQSISIVSDLASDHSGNVTMVYETIGLSTSQAFAVSGSISQNSWTPPVALSSDMNVSQIYFALAPSGTALAIWLSSSPTPEIHAVTRATPTGAWGIPVTVSQPGSSEIGPEAAAVNSSGKAIAIYSGYNAADVHTEYASTYTP